MIFDVITASLTALASVFCLLAAIGVARMPDLYTRMQSATKAGTLGVACAVLAAAFHFRTPDAVIEASIVIIFLFGTAPIASHLIARAAYRAGVPLWSQTVTDELGEESGEEELPRDDAARANP